MRISDWSSDVCSSDLNVLPAVTAPSGVTAIRIQTMTLRNGREFLAIPGPTNVPDAVLNAMHRPAVEIYTGPLVETTRSCLEDLKHLFGTRNGRTYIYAANGPGAWEAALTNSLSRGDKVLVHGSGRFPVLWGRSEEHTSEL